MKHAIFLSIDRRYHAYALLYLKSLAKHYPSHPDVLLHYHDLDPGQVRALARHPRVRLIQADVEQMRHWPGITLSGEGAFKAASACYARYWAWSGRYGEYDNLLFMDVDILVLGPLDGCLGGDRFRIGLDPYNEADRHFRDPRDPQVLGRLAEDGIELDDVNWNAGVILVPRRYRSDRNFGQLVRLTQRYADRISMADQSILNLWLRQQRVGIDRLEPRYNFMPGFLDYKVYSWKELREISVFHFAGLWQRPTLRLRLMQITLALSGTPLFVPYLSFLNVAYKFLYGIKKLLMRIRRPAAAGT